MARGVGLIFATLHNYSERPECFFIFTFQDGNKSIEDEELHGFLKDLMELVQEVMARTVLQCNTGPV